MGRCLVREIRAVVVGASQLVPFVLAAPKAGPTHPSNQSKLTELEMRNSQLARNTEASPPNSQGG